MMETKKYPLVTNATQSTSKFHINHLDEYLSDLPSIDSPILTRSWPINQSFINRDERIIGKYIGI